MRILGHLRSEVFKPIVGVFHVDGSNQGFCLLDVAEAVRVLRIGPGRDDRLPRAALDSLLVLGVGNVDESSAGFDQVMSLRLGQPGAMVRH